MNFIEGLMNNAFEKGKYFRTFSCATLALFKCKFGKVICES